jgi:diaminohydroxyphosphoribosylaminopyrimidine deaminase / 5-amino-6-(5-phosphoribosylamino)uracil reductase
MSIAELYMKKVIELAEKGTGFVNPQPLEGALLVRDTIVLGEGYRKEYRGETALQNALNNTSQSIEGAEVYLNLEPCFEDIDGRTAIDELIKAKIKKVYMGMLEPDPDNKGRFVDLLRSAGIEVETGILKAESEELNEIYAHYKTKGTPFVFVKWAMTLDGKIASRTGDSKWISGDDSLKFVHHLRQRVAAIMVGENTVRIDNPLLTTRLEGVEVSNPLRIIVSKYGNIPDSAKVLEVNEKMKTLVIASNDIIKENEDRLLKRGVEVLKFEEKDEKIQFTDITKALGERKIDSLYIEGGSTLLASAFESGIINKVYAAIAPKIIGGSGAVTPVGGIGIERMNDAIVLKRVSHEIVGRDVIIKGYIEG